MRGAATQAMSVYIVEEQQRSRCPPAAAPFQAAARRPAAKCQVILARALRQIAIGWMVIGSRRKRAVLR
jgi:hypothetical protein